MYKSLEEIREAIEESGKPFWQVVQEEDCKESGITIEESFAKMRAMYQAMKDSNEEYEDGLKSASGLVGTEGAKIRKAREAGKLTCGDFMAAVMEKALRISESNACMKRIVAAPTAGSCGVVPAVLLSLQEKNGYSDEEMTKALYVAAGIGGVIAYRASLSQSKAYLLPKLRYHFAEFLLLSSLKHLRILFLPTCVGLRYGSHMAEA